jgi:hypothetical protein
LRSLSRGSMSEHGVSPDYETRSQYSGRWGNFCLASIRRWIDAQLIGNKRVSSWASVNYASGDKKLLFRISSE